MCQRDPERAKKVSARAFAFAARRKTPRHPASQPPATCKTHPVSVSARARHDARDEGAAGARWLRRANKSLACVCCHANALVPNAAHTTNKADTRSGERPKIASSTRAECVHVTNALCHGKWTRSLSIRTRDCIISARWVWQLETHVLAALSGPGENVPPPAYVQLFCPHPQCYQTKELRTRIYLSWENHNDYWLH